MSQHAQRRRAGDRQRAGLRSALLWTGIAGLGVASIAGGAALGWYGPVTTDLSFIPSAAAATTTPKPVISAASVLAPAVAVEEPEEPPVYALSYPEVVVAGGIPPAVEQGISGMRKVMTVDEPAAVSTVYPSGSAEEYGVAIVIRIEFAYEVPDDVKAALEQTAKVTTSQPVGLAAWSWPNDTTMIYRPEEFWPAGTKVTLETTWEQDRLASYDPSREFSIGREQILRISASKAMGKLYIDGKFERKVPVSLGKATWETASGIKAIMERYYVKRMVNPGPREPYDVNVPFALRLTPSGEYLHAAPWNTWNLGVANTSHGCTNLSYEEGQWFYENALEGDPVITKGTGVELDWWEGPGASWNIDWAEWKADAAALP